MWGRQKWGDGRSCHVLLAVGCQIMTDVGEGRAAVSQNEVLETGRMRGGS